MGSTSMIGWIAGTELIAQMEGMVTHCNFFCQTHHTQGTQKAKTFFFYKKIWILMAMVLNYILLTYVIDMAVGTWQTKLMKTAPTRPNLFELVQTCSDWIS